MSLHLTTTLGANQRLEFSIQGDFFRLMAATQPVLVQYYRNGAEIAEADQVSVGYAERFRGLKFDRIAITNGATSQSVQIAARDGSEVSYDTPPTGQVTVTNTGGAFTQISGAALVDTVSQELRPAKANRRYLLIQNNHATGIVYVRLDGGAASVSTGAQIHPGGSLELADYCPTGQINAIGSVLNPNVIVLEG